MGFFPNSLRARTPLRIRPAVFSVGGRVYVACSAQASRGVALMDEASTNALAHLVDGTEVEILAWRPRGSSGARYRVRSTLDGVEGWLSVCDLRGDRLAASPQASAPAAGPASTRDAGAVERQFGNRTV